MSEFTYTTQTIGEIFKIVYKKLSGEIVDYRIGKCIDDVSKDVEEKETTVGAFNHYCYDCDDGNDIKIVGGKLIDLRSLCSYIYGIHFSYNENITSDISFNYNSKSKMIGGSDDLPKYKIEDYIVNNIYTVRKIVSRKFDVPETNIVTITEDCVIINGVKYSKALIMEFLESVLDPGYHGSELLFDGVRFVYDDYTLTVGYILSFAIADEKKTPKTNPENRPVNTTNDFKSAEVACVQKCEGIEIITYIDGTYKVDIPNFTGKGDIGIISTLNFGGEIVAIVNGEKKAIKYSDILYGFRFTPDIYMINYGKPLFLVASNNRDKKFEQLEKLINGDGM